MAKESSSPNEYDQHDPKVFRESLGSFGTTTRPGGNQLQELQSKVRQGVKHVELHLASAGKGQFNVQDVPDKYGFEQRRTIMQLAKLNEQTLSVHGSFDIVSFSGLSQDGFNEATRAVNMKEIDETLKFAAETAKSGAVVFHIQGDPIPTSRGELNVSKEYLEWLKKNKPEEYKRIEDEYFTDNPLNRRFVDNVDQAKEVRDEFEKLKNSTNSRSKERYERAVEKAKKSGRDAWEEYYIDKHMERTKASPDFDPLIIIGNKISGANRQQQFVDVEVIQKGNFTKDEIEILRKLEIEPNGDVSFADFQRINSIFTNGIPSQYEDKVSKDDFLKLKDKVLVSYDKYYKKNNYLQAQADKEFQQKIIDFQIKIGELQKEDIETNRIIYEDRMDEVRSLDKQSRELAKQIREAQKSGDISKAQSLKKKLTGRLPDNLRNEATRIIQKAQEFGEQSLTPEEIKRFNEIRAQAEPGIERRKLEIMQEIGQLEYQKLERHDELISQLNEQITKAKDQRDEIKAITDESFNKNSSAMGELGIKALRYQLDLKLKSESAKSRLDEADSRIKDLEKKYQNSTGVEQAKIHNELQKAKYEKRLIIGLEDYKDIDLVNKPLYLAPENMLPGYGSLTNLEEYKGVIRMSQHDFAKRILSNEPEYKRLREDYERATGVKITSSNALEIAKKHIGGTFDNAHAGTWLKHFKRENGESEEERIKRFNKWLNNEVEQMAKEGIVKHFHFNDTQAKDDDHNLLGSGILDIHDMRERLRKAGVKEPLIVEAGGRGGDNILHILNAFDIFNPTLRKNEDEALRMSGPMGYRFQDNSNMQGTVGSSVSDWVSVKRDYQNRPQYSQYGMGYSTFRHIPPQQGHPNRGDWSGTGFF